MKKYFVLLSVVFGVCGFCDTEKSFREKNTRQLCIVQTIGPRPVSGGRCRFIDEVMVGVQSADPLVILCAKLQVMCNREKGTLSLDSTENGG